MWIATNGCREELHEIKKVDGEWHVLHIDKEECQSAEFDVSDLVEG